MILQRNELDIRVVSRIMDDIQVEMKNLVEEERPPPVKKQWCILISDPQGNLQGKDHTGWVIQIPEEDSPATVQERIIKAASEASKEEIIALMVGRDVDDLYPRNEHVPGPVLLETENVCGYAKPGSSSFELREGEVFGIAGLVGAGRTELLESIFGLEPIAQGKVKVGAYSGLQTPALCWERSIGMVSEDRKTQGLALGLSIADNITLPKLEGLGPGRLVMPSKLRAVCDPWIKEIPIKCQSADQSTSDLSGGNQQKVAIARLLHANVDILLLDEPTRGIDVGSKAQIYRLIDSLARGDEASGRKPKAILLVSSYLPELLGTCDRIAVMCRGKLSEARPVSEWNEHELMAAAIGEI